MTFDPHAVGRIAQASLGREPTTAEVAALQHYLDQLSRWSSIHNLTAVREPERMLVQHLADCLAAVPPLRRRLADRTGARVLDVGSGGGLPGALIAIVAPDIDVTCIDAAAKKAAFVRQIAGTLALDNLHALHARVEQHLPSTPYDVVASRALATLSEFVTLTRHLMTRPGAAWMAMKGRAPDDEIAALPPEVEVFHVEPLDVVDLTAPRCLVWMRLRAR